MVERRHRPQHPVRRRPRSRTRVRESISAHRERSGGALGPDSCRFGLGGRYGDRPRSGPAGTWQRGADEPAGHSVWQLALATASGSADKRYRRTPWGAYGNLRANPAKTAVNLTTFKSLNLF